MRRIRATVARVLLPLHHAFRICTDRTTVSIGEALRRVLVLPLRVVLVVVPTAAGRHRLVDPAVAAGFLG
ncbi:MAG: hypothetical protein ACPHUD_09125 [Porticoccaceae bacterium]